MSVCDNDNKLQKYNTRRVLAQTLASLVIDFQYFSLGAAISYGPVEIAGLTSGEDIIKATADELSWIGSLCFIMQATGNLLGGPITTLIGRKKAMLFGNIPYVLAWILMWQSKSISILLLGNALVGLGTGALSAPMTSYLGEICEPSLRGVLTSFAQMFVAIGTCGVFVLGSLFDWRFTAAVYLVIACVGTVVVFLIPESPIWLLSKGREEEALRSLCWIRGWVESEVVEKEFENLKMYNKENSKCLQCEKAGINSSEQSELCVHVNDGWWKRFKSTMQEVMRRDARRPLIMLSLFFTFSALTGLTSIKPTMVNLLTAFNVPVDARWTMIYVGVITVFGALVCTSLVKMTGKRPLAITCMFGSFLCTLLMGVYAHKYIPADTNTFEEITDVKGETSVIPLVLFVIMVVFNAIGIIPITWMLISEVFPYNVRGICAGMVGAMGDFSFFVAAKTYLDVEKSIHVYGALYFYAAVTLAGTVYLYLFMIETENRSIAEIEATFADKDVVFYADDFMVRKINQLFRGKQAKLDKYPDMDKAVVPKQCYLNEAFGDKHCSNL